MRSGDIGYAMARSYRLLRLLRTLRLLKFFDCAMRSPAFISSFEKPEKLEQPESLEKLIIASEITIYFASYTESYRRRIK